MESPPGRRGEALLSAEHLLSTQAVDVMPACPTPPQQGVVHLHIHTYCFEGASHQPSGSVDSASLTLSASLGNRCAPPIIIP